MFEIIHSEHTARLLDWWNGRPICT